MKTKILVASGLALVTAASVLLTRPTSAEEKHDEVAISQTVVQTPSGPKLTEAEAQAVASTISQALATASANPIPEAHRPLNTSPSFVTIYTMESGEKYGVVDFNAADAPKADPRIRDASWLRGNNLKWISFVSLRPDSHSVRTNKGQMPFISEKKRIQSLPNTEATLPKDIAFTKGVAPNNVTPNWTYDPNDAYSWPAQGHRIDQAMFYDWWEDLDNYEVWRQGGPYVGCSNTSNQTRDCPRENTAKWEFTVSGHTKLTVPQVLELGFEVGVKYEQTDTFTFHNIPPRSTLWLLPIAIQDDIHWKTIAPWWVCGKYSSGDYCRTRWIRNWTEKFDTSVWHPYQGWNDVLIETPFGQMPY